MAFDDDKSNASSPQTALLSSQFGVCRICLEETDNRKLLSPCSCKGTAAFVHQECLDYWIRQSRNRRCETCKSKYELKRSGLKPMSEWAPPRPITENWEDLTDFYCAGLWAVLWMNVGFIWIKGGIASFNDTLLLALHSRRLVLLWWISFAVNSVYYLDVSWKVYKKWIVENSVFEWKSSVRGTR